MYNVQFRLINIHISQYKLSNLIDLIQPLQFLDVHQSNLYCDYLGQTFLAIITSGREEVNNLIRPVTVPDPPLNTSLWGFSDPQNRPLAAILYSCRTSRLFLYFWCGLGCGGGGGVVCLLLGSWG